MKSTPLLATLVTLLTVLYEGTYGSGILTIEYKYFDSRGRDSNGDYCDISGDCDPIFEICLRYGHGSLSAIFDCASNGTVSPQIYSEAYSNETIVTFGSIIGESVNPVVYITNNQFDGKFEISMVVVDQDILGTNDLIDHVIMMITAAKQTNFSSVLTFPGKRTIFVTTTALRYKFNCDRDYYGSYCTVYCVAQNNTNGRYTCDSETGAKICIVDYFGVDCDIDACQEGDTSCFKDSDGDGYPDTRMFCMNFDSFCKDNCPTIYNPSQSDCNGNEIGDACDKTCEPETDQIFFYNWTCTEGGETEYVPCFQGGGNASRLCKENGNWSDLIDTSNCFSPEYEVFRGNISIDQLEDLAKVVTEKEPASAGDIGLIVDVLNTTIEATLSVSTTERENIVNNTLKIVNVLAADSSQTLLVQSQDTTNVAQMVINILERQASSLALNQPTNVRLNMTENVFIETQTIDPTQAEGVVINADNIKGEKEGQTTPSVIVPIPKGIDPQKSLSVSVVVIKNIANLITSFADTITVGTGGLKLSGFSNFWIVSPVISVQLFSGNEQIIGNGTNPLIELSVPLSLSGIDFVLHYIKPTCLALTDSPSSNPQWYDGGIRNVSSNDIDSDDLVRCLSFHATPFVVLVGVGNLESQSVVLNILSYVGCVLSVICLLISLVIYLLFGRKLLKKIYHFVHFQLALSLCLLYLAFLFGVEPAYANVWLYIPCKIVTVVVEYLLLVVFLWMLMEGLVVLIMIMWPFHQFGWKHFVIFSLLSWGIPLLYVIPFIPFFHEYYISPPLRDSSIVSLTNEAKYCFLHNDETTNLILSVTIPLALIIILNVIILTAVIIRCILIITQQISFSKLQRAQKTSLRLLRLLIVMFPVLVFGWTFGLLAIYFNTAVFAWMFTILCAFQGILILFFVLLIRRDIQQSIVNALNLRAVFLTMLSRISSQFSKTVTSKESRSPTKQLDISKPNQKSMIDSQLDSEVYPPLTFTIKDLLAFYEERH